MPIAALLRCLGLFSLSGAAIAGNNFCNSSQVTFNDNGVADVYPSAINVVGAPGNITTLTVTINSFSHSFPDDVGFVLVGPGGQALLLQSGAGDSAGVSEQTYTFDDAAAATLPDLAAWSGGTYKPTNFYLANDNYPAPGPLTTYSNPGPGGAGTATLASVFAGTSANGTWNLFAADFASGDTGDFAGWCIAFTGVPVSLQSFSVD
ncbi:hypothetical protein [Tahibacter amnicola]|uniref:P/Homo B domain-containing protein n=1 Tax=Tahibacter amnicola TaxID=2976241 RepID=A0ABY6BC95_9GAMM|nr:hypothetical protein [Tahibacter amnicola]UXI66251.1 hypothetical protein N4264_16000 [Tahibacter amnicola]